MRAVVLLKAASDVANFGGKASNLATLLTNGIAVPDGLAIGIQAFGQDGHITAESSKHVQEWLKNQKSGHYAVRSSALNEDGVEQSWAGQFDTFLDVPPQQVIDKIDECHRTTSTRAQAYSQADSQEFNIAVIVQKMVPADYAGVLFTQNPVDGSNQLVIEYMAGLADQLVSGEVTPETCIWDRDTQSLEADQDIPFDIHTLIKQAIAIEEIYNSPQDIEWTFQKGACWIVQARPITTLA